MEDLEQLFADMEALLERIISQQRDKVMAVALDILPHLNPADIQDPQDYPEVAADTMRSASSSHMICWNPRPSSPSIASCARWTESNPISHVSDA